MLSNLHRYARFFTIVGSALCALSLSLIVNYTLNHITPVQASPSDGSTPVDLTLIPNPPTLVAGQEGQIDVYLHPNGRQVSAVELHLSIDPTVLEFTSSHPIATTSALAWALPNCQAVNTFPCPATSSATANQALIYLGASCDANGCNLPPTNTPFKIASLLIKALPHSPVQSSVQAIPASGSATMIAAFNSDVDVIGTASATTISLTPCALTDDLVPNGTIDIADIMSVASDWNTAAGNPLYNGQYDLDANHQINVADIQKIASQWRQSCVTP